MMLPLGDAPNPRSTPYVTYALLAANVAVYLFITLPLSATAPNPRDPLLQAYLEAIVGSVPSEALVRQILASVTAYDLFVFENGFRPAAPAVAALLTSLFLHAGFVHLFGNMLFLWIYGDNVEHRLGPLAYLAAYLGSGVAATLFHTVADLGSELPLIGASGAISGVLGLYFVWFPRNRVRLFIFLFPILMQTVYLPARLVLGVYLLIDNVLPFLIDSSVGGVAYGAHIGGFLAGLAVAYGLDRREITAKPEEYGQARRDLPDAGDVIRDALADGRFDRAAETYFSLDPHASRRVLSPSDSLTLGTWLRRAGHPHAALSVFRRHIRDYPRGPGLAEAHLGAGLVQLEELDQPTPAYQHFIESLETDPAPATAQEARRALAAVDALRKRARLEREQRPWWE